MLLRGRCWSQPAAVKGSSEGSGTAVYRVARWLTSVINKSSSWPQSLWGNSGILTAVIQFQYFPECTVLTCSRQARSRHQEFQVLPGSTWSAQHTALVQRQGKCQVVPTDCSDNKGNNTVSAGSEIARWSGGTGHATTKRKTISENYIAYQWRRVIAKR